MIFFQNETGKVDSRFAVLLGASGQGWFVAVRVDIYFLKVLGATASWKMEYKLFSTKVR